jgi:choline dehydrogenase
MDTHYDYLIVGGGSTGAVMARRVAEQAAGRILLLESGPARPDPRHARLVTDASQPAVAPGLNWKFPCAIKGLGTDAPRTSVASMFDYEAGRLLGGSSGVNATQALRGAPVDYDGWAARCGDGWSWDQVLPYFRKLESDPLGPSALHGSDGPFPIRRETAAQLTTLQSALFDACLVNGFGETPDHNDPATTGVGVIPKNVVDGVRVSTAAAYLEGARAYPDLTVLAGAHVHRLLWRDAGHCAGVEAEVGGELRQYTAGRVVLCAGVVGTPVLLMRSGVGDPAMLEALDIRTVVPLRGVGVGIMDHPVVGIWGIPKAGASRPGEPLRQVLLRFSSGLSGYDNDMHICMMSGIHTAENFPRLAADNIRTISGLTACFNKSTSRGRIRLLSADPYAKPQIAFNCLGDPGDVAPLREGVRLAWRLLQHPGLGRHVERILAWTAPMIASDVALTQAISTFVRPSAHACGSARMGRAPDEDAVVDPAGRVHGVGNLWIADGSNIPELPSAPPHQTCLMVAEKIADHLTTA